MDIHTTIQDLAEQLGVPENTLRHIAWKAPQSYYKKIIPKKDGSERIIYPPCFSLKAIQKKLLKEVLCKLPVDNCIGGNAYSSPKQLMKEHVDQKVVIRIDMSNFFPNIKRQKLYKILRSRGFSLDATQVILQLTTYQGGLPQGAPTSTQLARLAINAPIRHIKNLFKFPVKITVWVDDIVISGPTSIVNHIDTIYCILIRHGFFINKDKTAIMYSKDEQSALGIRVDHQCLEPDSSFMKKYRAAVAEGISAKSIQGMRNYIRHIKKK